VVHFLALPAQGLLEILRKEIELSWDQEVQSLVEWFWLGLVEL
jgi:hypothetical protein